MQWDGTRRTGTARMDPTAWGGTMRSHRHHRTWQDDDDAHHAHHLHQLMRSKIRKGNLGGLIEIESRIYVALTASTMAAYRAIVTEYQTSITKYTYDVNIAVVPLYTL